MKKPKPNKRQRFFRQRAVPADQKAKDTIWDFLRGIEAMDGRTFRLKRIQSRPRSED